MHGPNVHAIQLKISTSNFVEGVVSMINFMPRVEFCKATSRDGSISYDNSQLPKRSAIASSLPLHNLL
jgi:hypothetical protein